MGNISFKSIVYSYSMRYNRNELHSAEPQGEQFAESEQLMF